MVLRNEETARWFAYAPSLPPARKLLVVLKNIAPANLILSFRIFRGYCRN